MLLRSRASFKGARRAAGADVTQLSIRDNLIREYLLTGDSLASTAGGADAFFGTGRSNDPVFTERGLRWHLDERMNPLRWAMPALADDYTVGVVFRIDHWGPHVNYYAEFGDSYGVQFWRGFLRWLGDVSPSRDVALLTSVTSTDGPWYHITATLPPDSLERRSYKQGLHQSTVSFGGSAALAGDLGKFPNYGMGHDRYMKGELGLVYMYDRQLSGEEIATLHEDAVAIMEGRGVSTANWGTGE